MKKALLFICCSLCLQVFGQNAPVSYSKEDSLRVVELLELGAKEYKSFPLGEDLGEVVLFYARQFMNRRYVAHTLEMK
ncbi:MAG: hypothetical protein J6V61_02080, partial [Bacteroidaceae bacterium]|nr:hypothetical protein [Bacteroidaceae bacterium]